MKKSRLFSRLFFVHNIETKTYYALYSLVYKFESAGIPIGSVNKLKTMKSLKFRGEGAIPQLGLGTWKSKPGEVKEAVIEAIKIGYRHIDCAFIYNNEAEIGEAFEYCFENGLVSRRDLFVTSKLWNNAHREEEVAPALKKTLEDLNLSYLDLYLIHWPVAQKKDVIFPESPEDFDTLDEVPISETWKGMLSAKKNGLTQHVGVSNFSSSKLSKLVEEFPENYPELNQVELHPYLQQEELFRFCGKHHILLTGYSPLGSGDRHSSNRRENEPVLLDDAALKNIATQHNASVAQVLIAWHLERGTVVIPKSVNSGRIKENFHAQNIQLSDSEMNQINDLERSFRFIDGSFWTMEGSPYSMNNLWDE